MTAKQNKNIRGLLAAAVAMVIGGAGVADAQYRVDRAGANDANNRVGSGGVNPVDNRVKPWEMNNNIVYGNVTGGKEFRGPVGSFDSRAFRGGTADLNSDNFIRNSSGVSTSGVASYNTQGTREFYGESRAVRPPEGFVQIPGSGGYVPPRPNTWRTIDPRTGAVSDGGNNDVVFRPDQFGMPGAVDRQYVPGAVAVPSNISVRDIDGSLSDYTQLNRSLNDSLSADQAQRLYNELNGGNANANPNGPLTNQPNAAPGTQNQPQQPGDSATGALQQTTLNNTLNSSTMTPATLDSGLQPGGPARAEVGIQNRLMMSADQESTYAQLQARRQQQEGPMRPGQANERAAQEFNQQMQDKNAADTAGGENKAPAPRGTPGAAPAGTNDPNVKPGTDEPATEKPAPVRVPSLGGDKQGELNALMKKAEDSMREGKFTNAIETYETAERLVPANPLVQLGRAHAELGGGFYLRAEQGLRKTLAADENLLQGQYDLRGLIGVDRLQTVERDLSARMSKNEKDVGAPLLLAYVYYNTANETRAAALLDIADKRSGGNDNFVKLLKKTWALPGAEKNK